MYSKFFRLADTVFCVKSAMELDWGRNLTQFQAQGPGDVTVAVRYAQPGEPTPDHDGCCRIQGLQVALDPERYPRPTVWEVLALLPVAQILLERGTLVLHGAFVIHEGQGIVFSGPSGIGKTTQAGLWQQHRGAQVVNGDRVLIVPGENGVMAASHYLSGTSGVCSNESAPLRAIVLLEQAEENKIISMPPLAVFQQIMAQLHYQVSDSGQIIATTALVERLLAQTTVCKYACRIDENAVDRLEQVLFCTK